MRHTRRVIVYQVRTADRLQLIIAQFDTLRELAHFVGLSQKYVYRLIRRRKILPNNIYLEKFIIYDNR